MKILFSGGGGAGNEALWRLIGTRYDLYFGDADVCSIDPLIPQNRRIALPWASDVGFFHGINNLCKKFGIDMLVPGVDEELPSLAVFEDKLLPTKLFLPNKEYVDVMMDKLKMVNLLKEKGLDVPFTKKASDGTDGVSFPCIVKPRRGRGSRGVVVLQSECEARFFVGMLGSKAEEYVFQEKMDGVEYTVQMIADESGRLRAVVPVRVVSKRGITISAVIDLNESVLKMCRCLHETLPTKACYNIQLILSEKSLARPFEINPRISTTFCLTVASGIDPFHLFSEPRRDEDLFFGREGVTLHRYWKNVISG